MSKKEFREKEIPFHEPESNSTLALFTVTALLVLSMTGAVIIEHPELVRTTPILEKVAKFKEKEKSRRHIDNLALVDHWTASGKTRIYVDKKGNHVPFDAIERDPPKEKLEISEEDRSMLSSLLGGL